MPYPDIAHPYLSCSEATGYRNQSTVHFVLAYNEDYGEFRNSGKSNSNNAIPPVFFKKGKVHSVFN